MLKLHQASKKIYISETQDLLMQNSWNFNHVEVKKSCFLEIFLLDCAEKMCFSFQVLGCEVYTSNNQLGGIQIMHNNGVSHDISKDDYHGIYLLLKWLSYMPKVSPSVSSL